jgi:predicted negative regulator of RcsB-dependent stress response
MQDKALAGMRELQKEKPEDARVSLILSSMLSRSNDESKLKESLTILDKLSGDKTIQQYLVNMYKGDALIRTQDHDGALKHWKLALEDMPSADNRRAILEKRIADLSMKGQKPDGSGTQGKS